MTAPMPKEQKLTAHDLKRAICARYEPPEWLVEPEVTLEGRRLDVVAFNLWGARSYRIVGFEIKVSRGDWLRELDQFQKAEAWNALVDSFYVVTPPKLVKPEELPAGWGHLELCGSRMMTRAHANVREGERPLPRELVARFLDRIAQRARDAERQVKWRLEEELRKSIADELTRAHAHEDAQRREAARTATDDYHALLRALGIRPQDWRAQETALRAAGVFAKHLGEQNAIRSTLERAATALDAHTAAIRHALSTFADPLSCSDSPSA